MEIIIKKLVEIENLIKKQSILSKDFLTIEETAEYLKLSKSAIYKLTGNKKIPYYVPSGKVIYFKRAELDSWVFYNRIDSTEELNTEVNKHLNRNLNV